MSLPAMPHDALFRALVSNPKRAAALLNDYLGNYMRKSHSDFALISRVVEVANGNATRCADAPIPDASACLPQQWGVSAGPWPSNSVAEIGKATPHPCKR